MARLTTSSFKQSSPALGRSKREFDGLRSKVATLEAENGRLKAALSVELEAMRIELRAVKAELVKAR